ncbi:MAG: tetratricopeptide repeat protein [Spirochaetia bacterium]|nr:tetratricopeptide repeat protein [Spirochaetota bacterium]MCX8096036.1 tetratricopeptide repeat protein [Spirochaetota bacterium]MDW8111831.1 tetratricopeptide repeat protein [Spirochaetia bacterium]
MKTTMDSELLYKNSNVPKVQKAFELFKNKKFKEALEIFRDLYSKNSTNYEYNYYLGLTYANLGYFDVALNHLLYASKTNKNYYISIHSNMICGYIYTLREEYKLAENCFREVLKINSQSISALVAIAYVFEKTNRYDQSIIYLKRALEIDPDNPRVLNALAYVYAEREINLSDAVRLARKAVSHQPDSPEIRDTLAWAYYKKGEYIQAMNEIKKAMELLPNNEEILKHYKEISSKLEEIKSRTK